ncbi:MAG: alpha/beta hydrolase [Allomuricauda sp.]|nr:MAG: alpha/beta hydrolase [Allomuricauda sp.]
MQNLIARTIPLAYGQLFNLIALVDKRAAAIKAFRVFCTIRKGKVLPNQREFLEEAKHDRITIADHEIQVYNWEGSGETVLLMHGWESNSFRWRNLIKKLRENDFNILAFDAPAHGHSTGKFLHVPLYAKITRHILDQFNPKFVVAHSVGGMTIHHVHFLYPVSSLEKIVTIGAPAEFEKFMDHYQGLLKFNNRVRNAMNHRLKEWLGYYFHEFTSMRFAEKNTKKGLIFHDEEDKQVPVEASKKVHQHWKGSQLITTRGLGHSMHQEKVNDQIVTFLHE